jgi:hypothetical protein
MKWFQKRPERRDLSPEGLENRRLYAARHEPTDPDVRAADQERLQRALERAKEVAKIASVVTIRTHPK